MGGHVGEARAVEDGGHGRGEPGHRPGSRGCPDLRVDVSRLTFIDSYALGALVSARDTAAGAGVRLTLVGPSPVIRKAILVTGLGDVFGLPAGD